MEQGDSPTGGETPAEVVEGRGSIVLRHPYWAGITGIGTVILVALTLILLRDSKSSEDPAPGPGQSGNCNVVGDQNAVNCDITEGPARIGGVTFNANTEAGTWLFEGTPGSLPAPPMYEQENAYYHCPDWYQWMLNDGRFYTPAPGGFAYLTSGASDQVTIQGASVQILTRHKAEAKKYTTVQCNYQAGDSPGQTITVDTSTGTTGLQDLAIEDAPTLRMPPATLTLNGADASSVFVSLKGVPGYAYSGLIKLHVSINGEQRDLAIGTPDHPYRWLVQSSVLESGDTDPGWDWDPRSKRWVQGLSPDDVSSSH